MVVVYKTAPCLRSHAKLRPLMKDYPNRLDMGLAASALTSLSLGHMPCPMILRSQASGM